MCRNLKMINTTITSDGRQGLWDWPAGAVVNCCIRCVAADTRLENNPYQGISLTQAVQLLGEAVKKDRYKKITLEQAKEFIRECGDYSYWTYELHTFDWAVLVNFTEGMYDEDSSGEDETQDAIRRAARASSSRRTPRAEDEQRQPRALFIPRHLEDAYTGSRRRLENEAAMETPIAWMGEQVNVRERVNAALQRERGQRSRLPTWAERALSQLDDPGQDHYQPFEGQGRRLTD
jgi:hypothetical protein